MTYTFGKRLYNNKEEEYAVITSAQPLELEQDKFITYVIENDAYKIVHDFRLLWRFRQQRNKDGSYQSWYYIDNHSVTTIDKNIQTQLENQQIQIDENKDELINHSDILDDIIIDLLNR